jgi:hypothetical protein
MSAGEKQAVPPLPARFTKQTSRHVKLTKTFGTVLCRSGYLSDASSASDSIWRRTSSGAAPARLLPCILDRLSHYLAGLTLTQRS